MPSVFSPILISFICACPVKSDVISLGFLASPRETRLLPFILVFFLFNFSVYLRLSASYVFVFVFSLRSLRPRLTSQFGQVCGESSCKTTPLFYNDHQ
jgi:hypothetical protein